jgi:DNA ligase-1
LNSFLSLALSLERIRATKSKKEKVGILAEYLKGLSPEEASVAARMAAGSPSARGSREEEQVGYSTILEVLKQVTGASDADISRQYIGKGDLGEVAEVLLASKRERALFEEKLSLAEVADAFGRLRAARGRGSVATRKAILKSLLLRASPVEAKCLVKVLTGEMRTGLVQGLAEDAIAIAYGLPKEEVERAHMLLGDTGELAHAASRGGLQGVRIACFRPVNFMLAEPMATAREVVEHFGKTVYAEFKYDGVRVQVHKLENTVRIYSRRLEEITESFPELVGQALKVQHDFILDGEAVPFSAGRPLPFQLLQRRLRRIEGFDAAARIAPITCFSFDMLLLDGEELYERPLRERRVKLEETVRGSGIELASMTVVKDESEIQEVFRRSRALGYEGLVLKDPESQYRMGRRGTAWVKLKEELDTLDVVIVAAEYGHGKRAGVISDYTFAVRDGESLKTVGKAYSGLTDEEIERLTEKLKSITLEDMGYRRIVKPEVVLEVAFDSIQRSSRHDSGYALRFPRIKRIREDKSISEIDTLEEVERIFHSQRVKLEEA